MVLKNKQFEEVQLCKMIFQIRLCDMMGNNLYTCIIWLNLYEGLGGENFKPKTPRYPRKSTTPWTTYFSLVINMKGGLIFILP